MHTLSAFPGDIINQIVCNHDTSYVVIRLRLCGDTALNNKLSKCVTLIDLKRHPLSTCSVPRIVFELPSLRHLSLYSEDKLANQAQDWSVMMKSLPNTLESLSIYTADFADSLAIGVKMVPLKRNLHSREVTPMPSILELCFLNYTHSKLAHRALSQLCHLICHYFQHYQHR